MVLLIISSKVFVFIFIVVIGFVFLVFGIFSYTRISKIKNKGIKTLGKIINYKKETSINNDGYSEIYYYPIIQFTNSKNISTTITYNIGYIKKKQLDKVEMWYLETDNNYEIYLKDKTSILFPIVFMSLGLLMTVGAIIVFVLKIGMN